MARVTQKSIPKRGCEPPLIHQASPGEWKAHLGGKIENTIRAAWQRRLAQVLREKNPSRKSDLKSRARNGWGGEGVGYCTRAGCVPRNASVGDWAGRESKGAGSLRQRRVAATHGAAVPGAAGKRGAAGPPIWGAGQPGGRRSPGAVGTQRGTPAPRPLTRRPAAITRAQEAAPHRATPSPAPPPLTQSPPEDRDRHSPAYSLLSLSL